MAPAGICKSVFDDISLLFSLSHDSDDDEEDDRGVTGHIFLRKTFHKITHCNHCAEVLWGYIQTGFVCQGELLCYHGDQGEVLW